MERDPNGRQGVRFTLRDGDIPTIAASLAVAVHEQRGRFFASEGRLPDPDELRQIQNAVLNDWYLMIARIQKDQRRAES